MIKNLIFITIVGLRIAYQPADDSSSIAPFASPSPAKATTAKIPAKLISVDAHISNNKVILNWVVGENETADKFEVERSNDGKHFSMAALVFGTDAPVTGKYQFYEKTGSKKVSYRIKLINKDKKTEYSKVVEINPNV